MNPETFNVMLKFFEKVLEKEEEYKCKYCLKPFEEMKKLKIHSITQHLEHRFICDLCLKEYKYEYNLLKHIDMIHMKLDLRYLQKVKLKKVVKNQQEEDYEPESENETEDSDHDLYDDKGKKMKKPDREYPRKCDHCNYEVPAKKVHYHHYLIMHNDILDKYPYGKKVKMPCSYCGVLKAIGARLKEHEAKHSGIKVKCTLCEKKFNSNTLMKNHIRAVHTAPKFTCDYCTKGYKTRVDFVRHIRTHTGDKPYKCHICGAAFAHSGNRQIHIRSAHQNIKLVPKQKQVINNEKNKSSKIKKNKNSKKKDNIKNSKRKKDRKQKGRPKKVRTDSNSDSDDKALSVIKKKKK